MNKKGDLTQSIIFSGNSEISVCADYSFVEKNTSGIDNDEVDGNSICSFRKKKGIKGTTKHAPQLEKEKIEPSLTSKIPDPHHLQETIVSSEPPLHHSHQNLTIFPVVENHRGDGGSSHFVSNVKEDMSGETHDIPENANSGKKAIEKTQEGTETSGKAKLSLGIQSTCNTGKVERTEAVCEEEDRQKTEHKQELWGRMDEENSEFHMTKMGFLESTATTQGSDAAESFIPGISKQSLKELKDLTEGPLPARGPNYRGRSSGTFCQQNLKPVEKKAEKQCRTSETLSIHFGKENQKYHSFHGDGAGHQSKPLLVLSTGGSDQPQPEGGEVDQPILKQPETSMSAESSAPEIHFDSSAGNAASCGEPDINGLGIPSLLHLFSHIEFIKQQMARDSVQFVRFESIDLHGVSRSKNVPSRFFHEKAIHGVAMPRSYLELTLNPKDNEIDYINATNFNCDIILNPDLSTFRILPWTEQTARVICDSFTVLGSPLMTSPRHIAKKQLSELQDNGFSLHSAFAYEFCIYGITEVVNSKTISFPAATILNNHDQTFIQELIEGMYCTGANIESFSSSSGPGQMEITFHPAFGIDAADSAFTFRTGIKEVAKKYSYIASFFSESGFYNSGALSHSLWDLNGQKNLFSAGYGAEELTDIGKNWLSGLLAHSAAISCLMAPTTSCRKPYSKYSKESKETVSAKWAYNDNSCAFNVKCHGGKGTQIENKLSSATANPYLVLAATIAAGLDGVKRRLRYDMSQEENHISDLKPSSVPLKLEDALVALEKDSCIKEALGETFISYFIAMKHYELETEEMDSERNKCLGYFI
ncbi:lengsin isoform X1 [Cyrtonyx montezumae]|uniref:lengsin isoform X1 n=1 Tax=Cyrtonyx montezumae TaxID=9017 RepID=UPI0032D9F655